MISRDYNEAEEEFWREVEAALNNAEEDEARAARVRAEYERELTPA